MRQFLNKRKPSLRPILKDFGFGCCPPPPPPFLQLDSHLVTRAATCTLIRNMGIDFMIRYQNP